MSTNKVIAIGTGLAFGVVFGCLAAGSKLDVRTGLWEISSVGETSGTPPIPAETLAKLPPEQRAKIAAALQGAMTALSKPDVRRFCITDKTLERGMDLNDRERSSCKRTMLSSTPSLMELHLECTGAQNGAGTLRIQALNRQTTHGTFNMVIGNGANSMTINRTLEGKWLSADCGDVKPVE